MRPALVCAVLTALLIAPEARAALGRSLDEGAVPFRARLADAARAGRTRPDRGAVPRRPAAPPCGAFSSMSSRSSDCRSRVLPAAVSGVLRSERAPVGSTPGASVPLTDRSSDLAQEGVRLEPNSIAMVLLPVSVSEAPAGSGDALPAVAGRGIGAAASGSTVLSVLARSGRYDMRRYSNAGLRSDRTLAPTTSRRAPARFAGARCRARGRARNPDRGQRGGCCSTPSHCSAGETCARGRTTLARTLYDGQRGATGIGHRLSRRRHQHHRHHGAAPRPSTRRVRASRWRPPLSRFVPGPDPSETNGANTARLHLGDVQDAVPAERQRARMSEPGRRAEQRAHRIEQPERARGLVGDRDTTCSVHRDRQLARLALGIQRQAPGAGIGLAGLIRCTARCSLGATNRRVVRSPARAVRATGRAPNPPSARGALTSNDSTRSGRIRHVQRRAASEASARSDRSVRPAPRAPNRPNQRSADPAAEQIQRIRRGDSRDRARPPEHAEQHHRAGTAHLTFLAAQHAALPQVPALGIETLQAVKRGIRDVRTPERIDRHSGRLQHLATAIALTGQPGGGGHAGAQRVRGPRGGRVGEGRGLGRREHHEKCEQQGGEFSRRGSVRTANASRAPASWDPRDGDRIRDSRSAAPRGERRLGERRTARSPGDWRWPSRAWHWRAARPCG